MSTPVSFPNPVSAVANFASSVVKPVTEFIDTHVKSFHSSAALVGVFLSAFNVVPHSSNWTTGILASYAAVTKAVRND